jgi:glycosyltransferase involved in cell wall biosynthesis
MKNDSAQQGSVMHNSRTPFRKKTSCCVIPVYNNASTIQDVVQRTKAVTENILIIDDGSTDADLREYLKKLNVEVIRHETNRGKGAALCTALQILQERSVDYMITLDGDGQHYPEDLPSLLSRLDEKEGALLVGCRDFNVPHIPFASRIGRKLSNFWIQVETGISVEDSQSGFRAYPVPYVTQIACSSGHYHFETEILTRCAWGNLPILNHRIRTYYPPPGERISHFRPVLDTLRITRVHLQLVFCRLLHIPCKKLLPRETQQK